MGALDPAKEQRENAAERAHRWRRRRSVPVASRCRPTCCRPTGPACALVPLSPFLRLQVGDFGGDNRAGIDKTLHRVSCIRNRVGRVVGLTCRVGRAISGSADMVADLARAGKSILLLGEGGPALDTRQLDSTWTALFLLRVKVSGLASHFRYALIM